LLRAMHQVKRDNLSVGSIRAAVDLLAHRRLSFKGTSGEQ
jgi:hypothetical protein